MFDDEGMELNIHDQLYRLRGMISMVLLIILLLESRWILVSLECFKKVMATGEDMKSNVWN